MNTTSSCRKEWGIIEEAISCNALHFALTVKEVAYYKYGQVFPNVTWIAKNLSIWEMEFNRTWLFCLRRSRRLINEITSSEGRIYRPSEGRLGVQTSVQIESMDVDNFFVNEPKKAT